MTREGRSRKLIEKRIGPGIPKEDCMNGKMETAVSLDAIFDIDSYRSNISIPCSCGGTMEGEGILATGKVLKNGYKPQPNELIL